MVDRESPFAGVTALSSDRSSVTVTVPLVPPPDIPTPAVTPSISPVPGFDTPDDNTPDISSYLALCSRIQSLWLLH